MPLGQNLLLFVKEHSHFLIVRRDHYLNELISRGGYALSRKVSPYGKLTVTSVNEDSAKAKQILAELRRRMNGQSWLILPGHGAIVERNQSM